MMKPPRECFVCRGIGYVIERNPDLTGERWIRVPCKRCKGAGFVRE